MDRLISNVGESIYEWMFTKPDQNKMTALAKLAAALFGTSSVTVNGLSCVPTGPASMQVVINPGEIYSQASLEASVCGTLPADTTHQILKQGILLDAFTTAAGALPAPGTAGQSVNYLIEAQYADQDVSIDPTTGNTPVVLQFFNASNPTQPYSGPNNSGQTSTTFRKGIVSLQVKPGTAATTGSQTTPAPDAGWTGLWVVTVANGQSTITAGNIAQYAGAPILPTDLMRSIQRNAFGFAADTGVANAYTASFFPNISSLTDGMEVSFRAKTANTGASTFAITGGSALSIVGANFQALQGGEIIVNSLVTLQWNQALAVWVLIAGGGGAQQVAPASQSQHAAQLAQVGFRNQAIYKRIAGVQNVSINGGAFTTTGATTFPAPVGGVAKYRIWAGGGGGGGSTGGNGSLGGGGGGGGYVEGIATGLSSATAITVGAGGAGGTNAPTAGSQGGTSSFGAIASAFGGSGGQAQMGVGGATPGSGGGGSGGVLVIPGSGGGSGIALGSSYISGSSGGAFGTTSYQGPVSVGSSGFSGIFPGGGATGTNNANATPGADGLVIVEY